MKTILTIDGTSYLLPRAAEVSKILDLLQGVMEVKSQTIYGPDGDKHYDREFYQNKEVVADHPARFRVELVPDGEVCTIKEFAALKAETEQRIAALAAASEEVSARG